VLQHILNPAFLYSFEKGEGEQLLGPPNPEGDNPESITSVFITKVSITVYVSVRGLKHYLSHLAFQSQFDSCATFKYYEQLNHITTLSRYEVYQSSVGLD